MTPAKRKMYKKTKRIIEISPLINHVDELEMEIDNDKDEICFIHANDKLYANYSPSYYYDYAFGLSGDIHNVKKMLQLLLTLNKTLGSIAVSTVYIHAPLDDKNDVYDETGEYDFSEKIYEDTDNLYIFNKLLKDPENIELTFEEQMEINDLCDLMSYLCDVDYTHARQTVLDYFNLADWH